MTNIELANEYEKQAEIIDSKIKGLTPLLMIYKGNDLYLLKKRIRIYQDMACECKKTAKLLKEFETYDIDEDIDDKNRGDIMDNNCLQETKNFDFVCITDKVRLIQPMGNLTTLGEIYEIGAITEEHFVIRDTKNRLAVASVSVNDFYKYFEKDTKRTWTNWVCLLNDEQTQAIGEYRTNGKKVQVKIGKFRAESSCYTTDIFNLGLGIGIAYCRCFEKVLINKKYNDVIDYNTFENMFKVNQKQLNKLLSYANK